MLNTSHFEEMGNLLAVAKEGSEKGEICDPRGIAIDPITNEIYVTERRNKRVSIFTEFGEFVDTFSHELMEYPWGIAVHRDNIYVTDIVGHHILHFKVAAHTSFVARVGSKGSDSGQFNGPRQITISANGDIFVTDFENHRIQILDSHLHFQRQFSHHSMTRPMDVKLFQEEVYVLSGSESSCVHVFSHTGDLLRSLLPASRFTIHLCWPMFFSLDSSGNFIISDWCHRVKIFSKHGEFLYLLGRRGHQAGMFDFPCGIAITNNLKLAVVSENRQYGLQIFY